MNVWAYEGKLYEVNSYYSLPDDAWQYELVGLSGAPGTGPHLAVLIPDATPDDGPFTPGRAEHIQVLIHNGQIPWPVLRRFVDLIVNSGDVTIGTAASSDTGTLTLSSTICRFADRRFEVNSFYFGDRDSWCYELFEIDLNMSENAYIAVLIPDAQPADGPFIAAMADQVTVIAHGASTLPWLVFQRFLDAVGISGDILEGATTEPPQAL